MPFNIPSFDPTILLLVVPLILLQLTLMLLAGVDLVREDRRVRGGSRAMWAIIIVFVNVIGPILYFLVGREEGVPEEHEPGPGAMPGWGSPHDPPAVTLPTAETPGAGSPAGGIAGLDANAVVAARAIAHPEVGAPVGDPAGATLGVPARDPLVDGPAAIEVVGLAKRYEGGVLALDGLSMVVPVGSVFGLLGPNGAGKTTCLRLLAGMTRPTAGRAIVNGTVVASNALAVRRSLGYLEQDPRVYGWMTGREQLTMLGQLHGLDGPALRSAVDDALARVDLADAADRRSGTYSGGMRQRLGIAGALVHRPPVIVLDEPVSALDPGGRRDVLELIASLRGRTTVLFSTHVLADVERICDRVAILDHGRLVVEGSLSELLDRFALPVYRVEAEPGQAAAVDALAARLRTMDWVTGTIVEHGLLTIAVADPTRAAHELLPVIALEGVSVISVARARPTLEDVFLRLTGDGQEAAA
jgi:ABC-2 type transport system ATP-binding protein